MSLASGRSAARMAGRTQDQNGKERRDVAPSSDLPTEVCERKGEMEDRSSRRFRALMTLIARRGMAANQIGRALISMMVRSTKLQRET